MDIKFLLKEAREAIKHKKFEDALKLCKQVLKYEKENYTALVFLGVSLQETGQSQSALKAFRIAIRTNPTNPLAFNGLVNHFEKIDSKEAKTELVEAYTTILAIESNEKKLLEYSNKLCNLSAFGDVSKMALAVHSVIKSGKCQEVMGLWSSLVTVISTASTSLKMELANVYEEALTAVLSNPKTTTTENYDIYLDLLYRQNRIKDVVEHGKKMHSLFQINSSSLRWICRVFNESYIESDDIIIDSDEDVRYFYESLLRLDSRSPEALLTKSVALWRAGNEQESKEILTQVVDLKPEMSHAWVLLARCCAKLLLFSEAVNAVNKVEKFLSSRPLLRSRLNLCLIVCLSKSAEEEDCRKVLELYETIDDDAKKKCLPSIIRANISLGYLAQARVQLTDIKSERGLELQYKLLMAQLLHAEGSVSKALKLLADEDVPFSEWWMELGLLYWDMGEKSKSLVPFLKAAKLEPANYRCFLLLGKFYLDVGDLDKARRCYQKSFKINPKCSEAGVELSKIYMKLKNWEANLALLQSLTSNVINKKNSWAWLQLGLNYLEQENYDKAVNSLRYVIRIDPDNMHCWESLADAYLAKGAYTSAHKCYARAAELCSSAVYPLLQMANIKQILGEYTEARQNFEEILKSNKLYVPALKGLAETCLHQARECFRDQRLGTARDHAQFAAEKLITAIQQRSDLACLWKLLGDSCFFVTKLPDKFCCLLLVAAFVEGDVEAKGNNVLEREELFVLAARCYCQSLHVVEDNVFVWHDLGTCYLSHALSKERGESFDELMGKARAVAQHCISTNPTYWQHWNLLGNIAFSQSPPNYRLAQHAFIKAVMADNNSAVSWCNLGTLYLILGDFKLANEAFSQAQRSDPNFVNSWIGQALLAENFSHHDAMDLFRHSTQLSIHKQGALGYGHWVCKTLVESPSNTNIYSIHNMHAIPVACDALTWYTEKNPDDGSAWNMLGILRERLGLKEGAKDAFKNALYLSRKEHRDHARVNFGRLLYKTGKYPEAIEMFEKVEAATFSSGSGLALAHFKNRQFKESYETYESALHWLTEEQSSQSDLLVALASMAYMFEGAEAAKTLLFQSIQLEKPSPWAFYATLSLGLLHQDLNLAQLVFKELSSIKDLKENLQHYSVLTAYLHLLKGDFKRSVQEVSKLVHRYPDQACAWLTLSSVLMRVQEYKENFLAAARCAQIAMRLGQANMDVTKVLCLVSLSSLLSGDKKKALLAAQKAVHCYPDVSEAWAVFVSALMATKNVATPRVRAVLGHIRSLPTISEPLALWTKKVVC